MEATQADVKESEDKLKAPSLLHSIAVIVILLVSIILFNATIRAILGSGTSKFEKTPVDLLYDPDIVKNWTNLCPSEKKVDSLIFYNMKWIRSSCFNKTMHYWYIPWVRTWVWKKFDDITAERKRLKEQKIIKEQEELLVAQNDSHIEEEKLPPEQEENNKTKKIVPEKEKEPTTNNVYTILTAMTLMSAIIALLELFREKLGKKPEEGPKDDMDRRCSLADFTIKRHERKESQQESLQRQAAFDEPKKVKPLQQQGSLDRGIAKLTPPVKLACKLPRQRSMPCRHPSLTSLVERSSFQSSLDIPDEEASPSLRRKSRHFIRRH